MAQCIMDYPPLQSHAPRMANSCSLAFLIFGIDLKPAGHTLSSINIFQTWPFYTESYQIFHCVWTKGCSSAVLLKPPPLNP